MISGGAGGADDLTVINNDGGAIWAGFVTDPSSGEVYRGNAINTEGLQTFNNGYFGPAPNAVEINLTGNNPDGRGNELGSVYLSDLIRDLVATDGRYGYIFGDIEMGANDIVRVYDGYTIFDGVINPDGQPEGDLSIEGPDPAYGYGSLVLIQNEDNGPSQVLVENFYQEAGGSVVYELTPDTSYDSYSHIEASDDANVEGNVELSSRLVCTRTASATKTS